VATIVVNRLQDGMRIDRLLISEYKDSNILDIWKFIKNKEIRVNEKSVAQNHRVNYRDRIAFSNFVEKIMKNPLARKNNHTVENKNARANGVNSRQSVALVTNSVIYEDNNLLVIDKPYDLPVQGGSGITVSVSSIISSLSNEEQNLKLVHRLDRYTTGVLIIAKNIKTADELTKIFRSRRGIKKEYLLIVNGHIAREQGLIDFPLVKKYENNLEKVYVDHVSGQKALTKYSVLAYSEKYSLSFVKAEILTGRTHQIRVHFREIGNSLLGDFKYGNKHMKRSAINADKLQLHSYRTTVDIFGKRHIFVADIPGHMKKVLASAFFNYSEILSKITKVF
jgi:23S rRNA pseudouridine955/2504/2580 synthase